MTSKIKPFLVLAVFSVLACSHLDSNDSRTPAMTGSNESGVAALPTKDSLPYSQAFAEWHDLSSFVTTDINPNSVKKIALNCASKLLYPTHPQQETKLYHVFAQGMYDAAKLTADAQTCIIGSKYKNAQGVMPCLRADPINYGVLSDTFVDGCGNSYRAFWSVTFFDRDEEMGTLCSKGRTLYPNPHPLNPRDQIEGGTYAVAEHEFMFLSPLTKTDAAKITRLQNQARQGGFSLDAKTHIFTAPAAN